MASSKQVGKSKLKLNYSSIIILIGGEIKSFLKLKEKISFVSGNLKSRLVRYLTFTSFLAFVSGQD
jgi:hypothetical protein